MNPSEDLGRGWYKCNDCGATWSKQSPPHAYPMHLAKDDNLGKSYSPTPVRRKPMKEAV